MIKRSGSYEHLISITHTAAEVHDKHSSRTIVGVNINEDCMVLAALNQDDIVASAVIDYPEIQAERYRYFTMRKRMQNTGKSSFERKEERFVHDQLHKVSWQVVEEAE